MGEEAVGEEGEVVSGAPPAVVRRLASTKPLMTAAAATENVVRCAESSIAWRVAWLVVEVLPPASGVFHFVSRPL